MRRGSTRPAMHLGVTAEYGAGAGDGGGLSNSSVDVLPGGRTGRPPRSASCGRRIPGRFVGVETGTVLLGGAYRDAPEAEARAVLLEGRAELVHALLALDREHKAVGPLWPCIAPRGTSWRSAQRLQRTAVFLTMTFSPRAVPVVPEHDDRLRAVLLALVPVVLLEALALRLEEAAVLGDADPVRLALEDQGPVRPRVVEVVPLPVVVVRRPAVWIEERRWRRRPRETCDGRNLGRVAEAWGQRAAFDRAPADARSSRPAAPRGT